MPGLKHGEDKGLNKQDDAFRKAVAPADQRYDRDKLLPLVHEITAPFPLFANPPVLLTAWLAGNCEAVTRRRSATKRGLLPGEPLLASSQSYNLGNPLSLTLGTQSGMKSISCTIWVFGALMVMASLDPVADPPAVSPQAVNVISHRRERTDGFCERLTCDSSCTSSRLQICWVASTSAHEPNRPSDRIALTGHASDPSPPALEARRTLYFQS
jgi:hypothetical protein